MLPIQDKKLLDKAFTHRSYLNESTNDFNESNERLEYLGDAVLELVVSQYLFHQFPDKPEGELTALRASLVKTTTLASVAKELDFGSLLYMSKGEAQTGGRDNESLLANTFEAVVGAIYLDSGFDTANDFISKNLFPLLPDIIKNNLHKDFKSEFQETVQAQGHPTPTYKLLSSEGPDHEKTFTMALMVGKTLVAKGNGSSKQRAQQEAAEKGLKKLAQGYNL